MKLSRQSVFAATQTSGADSPKSTVREYAEAVLVALIIALFIRTFIVQTFKIPSGSMEGTLSIGDYLIVNKFIYGITIPLIDKKILNIKHPQQGDIIVFAYPKDESKDFIKRIVGIPGDQVEIRDKKVYVNGVPYNNPHAVFRDNNILPDRQAPRDNFGPVRVPRNSYFVMGDNRDNSYDSRFWGFVGEDKIKGRALIKYWSWDGEHLRVRRENIGRLID